MEITQIHDKFNVGSWRPCPSFCTSRELVKRYAEGDCAAFAEGCLAVLRDISGFVSGEILMLGVRTDNHFCIKMNYQPLTSTPGCTEEWFLDARGVFENLEDLYSASGITQDIQITVISEDDDCSYDLMMNLVRQSELYLGLQKWRSEGVIDRDDLEEFFYSALMAEVINWMTKLKSAH